MKPNKNNIENIFKEQFQDFEVAPAEHLWENISKEIEVEKQPKKVIPLWYWGSGIAASFVLLLGVYFYLNSENETIVETQVVHENSNNNKMDEINVDTKNNTEESSFVTTKTNTEKESDNVLIEEKVTIVQTSKKTEINASLEENIKTTNNYESVVENKNQKESNYFESSIASNQNTNTRTGKSDITTTHKNSQIKDYNNEKPTIEKETVDDLLLAEILKDTESERVNEDISKEKKWSIQPQVGTFYYNSFAGSAIGESFSENPQNLESSFSYGARIAYQISPKLKIRSGLTYNSIKLTTSSIAIQSNSVNDVFTNSDVSIINVYTPGDGLTSNDVDADNFESEEEVTDDYYNPYYPDDGQESVDDPEIINEDSEDPIVLAPTESSIQGGTITQQINYLEIPVEAAYNILDKKINIDLLGGLSTFILANNDSYFQSYTTNTITQLGETSALNNTSFTANFGFSANYNMVKNLSFNIEPILKIQFNALNNNATYSPYFIGISSGLTWDF